MSNLVPNLVSVVLWHMNMARVARTCENNGAVYRPYSSVGSMIEEGCILYPVTPPLGASHARGCIMIFNYLQS